MGLAFDAQVQRLEAAFEQVAGRRVEAAAEMAGVVANTFLSSAALVTAMPHWMSLWPPRYFVPLCTTTSIPSAIGFWWMGVAKVLSITYGT